MLSRGWAKNPGNTNFYLNVVCIKQLVELLKRDKGKKNKTYRLTTERSYDMMRNNTICNDWSQKKILTVSKFNIFSKKPKAMHR